VDRFVTHYNTNRLHSAIGYVTRLDMPEGRQKSILEARDRKLEEARLLCGEKRRQQKLEMPKKLPARPRIPEVDSSSARRIGQRWEAPRAPDGRRRQNSSYNIAGLRPANTRCLRQLCFTTEALPFSNQTSVDGQIRKIPGVRGLAPDHLQTHPTS
jgi:hypothetical protein